LIVDYIGSMFYQWCSLIVDYISSMFSSGVRWL